MTFKPNRRVWFSAIATLLATAIGACAGYLKGRTYIEEAAETNLQQDAARLSVAIHSLIIESYGILAKANALEEPACSDAEIAQLRRLIYHSVNFRELGRIRDGKILCSALFGRNGLPQTQFKPASHFDDGTTLYRNMAPYAMDGVPVYIRQRGDYFAVEAPGLSVRIHQMRRNHEVFSSGATGTFAAASLRVSQEVPGAILDRDARGRIGDTLFATYCTGGDNSQIQCATSYGSFSEHLRAQEGLLVLHAALGGMVCGFPLAIFLLLYWRRRSLPQQLLKAIRGGKLHYVYQPIVDLPDGRVVAAEALARWNDDDGVAISPEIFVRLAEERGFSLELLRLALRRTLHDFADKLRDNAEFRMHINLTASDLADAGLLPMLEQLLTDAGVAPHRLAFELTEGATARHSITIDAIHRLRQRGHSVQIDDFGTGYSSLAYLKDLAVDAIKIDRAFTQAIGTEAVTGVILPQILTMAAGLGLLVIAEGIETAEQAAYFANFDQPILGQGWLFGRPQPPEKFLRALKAQEDRQAVLAIEK